MAGADVAVFEFEFQDAGKTIIALPAIEFTQIFVNEVFYYVNITADRNRLMWAWLVFVISVALGVLLSLLLAFCFVTWRTSRKWRMHILMICFMLPVMLMQIPIQETYFYLWPGNYPDRARLIATGVGMLITWVITPGLCWLFCSWCDCVWKCLAQCYYARLPTSEQ